MDAVSQASGFILLALFALSIVGAAVLLPLAKKTGARQVEIHLGLTGLRINIVCDTQSSEESDETSPTVDGDKGSFVRRAIRRKKK